MKRSPKYTMTYNDNCLTDTLKEYGAKCIWRDAYLMVVELQNGQRESYAKRNPRHAGWGLLYRNSYWEYCVSGDKTNFYLPENLQKWGQPL